MQLLDSEDPESGEDPETGGSDGAPEASPEHAAAADDSSAEPGPDAPQGPPVPGQPGGTAHLPTLAAGQTPPPGPVTPPRPTPHPAYGYPQQHPQPPAYGYPQQPGTPGPGPYQAYGGLGSTPPYGPPPAGPGIPPFGPPPGVPRRSGRSTAALIVVAVIVALGAGGSVYALMNGGDHDGAQNNPTTSPTATGAPTTPEPSPTSAQPSTSTSAPADGAVPTGYLGTWTAAIDNATGHNTRELTIQQGEVGDTVLSLVADGPADGGTYHCVFQAELSEQPAGEAPLAIGPSTVTSGEPLSSCNPGAASTITLLSDDRLQRVNTDTGEKLTYTR